MVNHSVLDDLCCAGYFNRHWYVDAEYVLRQVAKSLHVDGDLFIDIFAITSPRVTVSRNLSAAKYYAQHGVAIDGTIMSTRAALAHYDTTGEIRGPKTQCFAGACSGEKQAIVLDTWMAKAMGVPAKEFSGKKKYKEYSTFFRRWHASSKYQDLYPCEAQAAVWAGAMIREFNKPTIPNLYKIAKIEESE